MADRIPTSTDNEVKKRRLSGFSPQSGEEPTTLSRSTAGVSELLTIVAAELKAHAPYTILGTATGLIIMVAFVVMDVPRTVSVTLFWSLHPLHVLLAPGDNRHVHTPWPTHLVDYRRRRICRLGGHCDPQ